MNNKAQLFLAYAFVGFLLIIVLFALIPAFKDVLDGARGESSTLNCPGTPTFNQANYDDDNSTQQFIRRPVCFVTGISMVWFVGAFVITLFIFLYRKWTRG